MRDCLFRKGLVAFFIVSLMLVTVLSVVFTANAVTIHEEKISEKIPYTLNNGVDIAIIELTIDYNYYDGKYINLIVKNVGDVTVEYFQVRGTLHRYNYLLRRFIFYADAYARWTPPGGGWTPGKVYDNIRAMDAPEIGYCRIYLRLETKGDVNPDNNIIDGLYYTKGYELYPIAYQREIEPYNIRLLEHFPLLKLLFQRFRI